MTLSISSSAAHKMKFTTPAEEQALNALLANEECAHVTGAQVEAVLAQVHAPQTETSSARDLFGAMGSALTPVSYAEIMARIEALAEDAPGTPVSSDLVAAAMSEREGL